VLGGGGPLALLLQAAPAVCDAQKALAPGGSLPALADILVCSPLRTFATALGGLGDLLWVVAYVFIVRAGFRDRTYGLPLLAICLNFTWEFWLTAVSPPARLSAHVLHGLWFVVDAIIVWQLFRFGRAEQRIPVVRRYFPAVVLATMAFALVGQVSLRAFLVGDEFFPDVEAIGIAYFDNLVMAILLVMMYFERPNQRGLSLAAAWAMTVGTTLISIGNVIVFNTGPDITYEIQFRPVGVGPWLTTQRGTDALSLGFFYFLFVGILVMNAVYLVLLHRARQGLPVQGADATAPARA
jgi:hypothetical protein